MTTIGLLVAIATLVAPQASPVNPHDRYRNPKGVGLGESLMALDTDSGPERSPSPYRILFVEAEMFEEHGGWDLDQQSMDVMGSPFLLAHGLGVPVKDATTTIRVPSAGEYHVWVRTRDWVAPWKVAGAPGRFQVLLNGTPLNTLFGTEGAAWHWQRGDAVRLAKGEVALTLHDLTGFEGRCDAIVLSPDPGFVPPNDLKALEAFRYKALRISPKPKSVGSFDLVVCGGGMAGICAAISAARNGLTVALVQDRPVLGGNASSEVRVWPEGETRREPFPHIGEIVEELLRPKDADDGNAKSGPQYGDARKLAVVQSEPNIHLFLNQRVVGATVRAGKITCVDAQSTRSPKRIRISGRLFADCTGDASLGALAGADFEVTAEGKMGASNLWNLVDMQKPEEVIKCECKDKDLLSVSMTEAPKEQPFPRCPWALDLTNKPFPGRKNWKGQWADAPLSNLGGWFWESGYNLDMVKDIELIRDHNLRAMYGAWDALKNVDGLYPYHRLNWVAFIAGKRESRRLLGDVVLTGDDFRKMTAFPDPAYPCSWHIDLHSPHPSFSEGLTGQEFISLATDSPQYRYQGPYWAPYRTLYSRNVSNLFMAGRNVSVTHEGLGPVRVMRTTGMMGEIVGKAAALCVRHRTTPRGVYQRHLGELQKLMELPGSSRPSQRVGGKAAPDYDFQAMVQPVPKTAVFSDPEFNIWCGSAVKGDDGMYHMYYSRWPRRLGHLAWVTHSEVAHAVSRSPFGPWVHQSVALPARGTEFWDGSCTHNPTVIRHGGKYYLYYMGNFGDGVVGKELNWTHRNRQRIGVAVAESPDGPWKRFPKPLLDIGPRPQNPDSLMVNNPAVAIRPDGGILMIYKAAGMERPLPFGGPIVHLVATSNRPLGPFRKRSEPIFGAKGVMFAAEDPFVWFSDGSYWAVVKDNDGHFTGKGYSLALWRSDDGFAWRTAQHPLVATPSIRWEDGTTTTLSALERPQVLFENGKPIAILCAAADRPDRDGSFNVQIPLLTK